MQIADVSKDLLFGHILPDNGGNVLYTILIGKVLFNL